MKKDTKKTVKTNNKKENLNIKQNFDKLDKLLKTMEENSLDLEKNLKLYEEALQLINNCKKSIEESKAKFILLEED